jgi:putative pyruvate formate lyase activating enzyme
LVDIYLPDFKYSNNDLAYKYSGIKNYIEKAEETIREMIDQVGAENVIIRHLILPDNADNSVGVLKKIKEMGKDVRISLMTQYEPVFRAKEFPEINRRITEDEFEKVHNHQLKLGLIRGWVQEMGSQEVFLPDFTGDNPFQ